MKSHLNIKKALSEDQNKQKQFKFVWKIQIYDALNTATTHIYISSLYNFLPCKVLKMFIIFKLQYCCSEAPRAYVFVHLSEHDLRMYFVCGVDKEMQCSCLFYIIIELFTLKHKKVQ